MVFHFVYRVGDQSKDFDIDIDDNDSDDNPDIDIQNLDEVASVDDDLEEAWEVTINYYCLLKLTITIVVGSSVWLRVAHYCI